MTGLPIPQNNADPDLQQTLAFNDLLKNLVNAKVPVLLNDNLEATPILLDDLNRELALQVSRGDTIGQALDKCPLLTSFYKDALAAYSQSPNDLRILDLIQSQAWNHALSSRRFAYSRGKLLVLWLLTGAVLSLLLANIPRLLLQMYEVSGIEPRQTTILLKTLADHYVICWLVFAVFAGLLLFCRSRYFWKSSTVGNATNQSLLHNYFQTALPAIPAGNAQLNNQTPASTYPWQDWINDPTISASENSNRRILAAQLLSAELASRNYLKFHTLPVIVHLLLGGLMVLTVSVLLFLPLIELLVAICQP